ncbi:MAG: hypothetical protein KatS3mg057_1780 [Herpetosiphonaceae bacterium]|nr:MAG: hypothetical protein KatS3mg057_1780 [Herpetosiphonaceae bacterium]
MAARIRTKGDVAREPDDNQPCNQRCQECPGRECYYSTHGGRYAASAAKADIYWNDMADDGCDRPQRRSPGIADEGRTDQNTCNTLKKVEQKKRRFPSADPAPA